MLSVSAAITQTADTTKNLLEGLLAPFCKKKYPMKKLKRKNSACDAAKTIPIMKPLPTNIENSNMSSPHDNNAPKNTVTAGYGTHCKIRYN